jgi:hypothetical protein
MKRRELKYILLIPVVIGLVEVSCKKEESTSSKLTTEQISQVQNSDVQDAVADKNDQDIDNTLDQLQVSNYSDISARSYANSGTRTIIVDHPDSTSFPKVITIIYSDWEDSTAGEKFIKNGEIDVIVTKNSDNPQLVTRSLTFKDYSVTTDSTTLIIKGTRSVIRTDISYKFKGLESLRLVITDQITADLSYAITKTGASDTLKFTRDVAKTRKSYLHYINEGGLLWRNVRFRNIVSRDTVTYSGTVTGINEKGENYSKTVSSSTPLVVIFYRGTPVIASGTLELAISGSPAESYTFTYAEDPDHPHMTKITVTDNVTQKTYTFDRRYSRKFIKWW